MLYDVNLCLISYFLLVIFFQRDTVSFLRDLSASSSASKPGRGGGRFHAYSVTETEEDPLTGQISYYGGTPPGWSTIAIALLNPYNISLVFEIFQGFPLTFGKKAN